MSDQNRASPWWDRARHADRRPFLLARNRVLAALRGFFEERGFLEFEAAILQVSPGNETHLHAFATELVTFTGERHRLYLHTSPEFAAKKLLAAGEERLFTFARVFRNRERTTRHHPEFTMLEWYRAGAAYTDLMEDCRALLAATARALGVTRFSHRGVEIDPFAPPQIITVAQAFETHAGVDLAATLSPDGGTDREGLARQATAAGLRVAPDDSWSDIFSRIISERVEPRLGIGRASILTDYPVPEAALARPKPDDPRFSERFELYACGLELANAFGELTDPAEQRRRFAADMDEKERLYGERYPIDEDFLAALAHMPPAAGIALGLDRLVMAATGAERIEQVVWTPLAEI